MLVQLAVTVVSFGCARYGRTAVVWLSGLSIPAAAVIGITYVTLRGSRHPRLAGRRRPDCRRLLLRPADAGRSGVSALVPLVIPWLVGLMLRISEQARTSREAQHTAEEARSQAEEIAHLREEQARMARDVHDVVGHSLAVILAQAESAQFIKDSDTQALKKTMENIATSARSSLQDVRQVLTTATERQPSGATGGLDSLIEGVRSGGYEVVSSEVGKPQPLPPELEVVAFRVLQEMLTNAIKYGRRGEPVSVERHWEGELRIEVRNIIGTRARGRSPAGTGAERDAAKARVGRRASRRTPSRGGRGRHLHHDSVGAASGGPVMSTPIRVLLVDDQELFRAGVAVIVDAQEDMEVVGSAADGVEAVRLVDELEPDVVLMDIRMPEMDGVEATRQIFSAVRTARREKPVRVVVLTTFNLDDRAATAIRYGASGFLLKDTTPVLLRDAIRTVYSGNAVLAPQDLSTLLEGQFRARLPVPAGFASLTDKEREVFAAVARGLSNTEIAGQVFASESTVKTHVGAILRKLNLRDRVQIVVFAHEHGLAHG